MNPESWFFSPSGGLGWGVPAAVGIALGDRDRGVSRPVIGLIGDGSTVIVIPTEFLDAALG